MSFCLHCLIYPHSISYGSYHPILKIRKVRLWEGHQFHQAATASLGQSLLTPNPAFFGIPHNVTSWVKEEIITDRKEREGFQNKGL